MAQALVQALEGISFPCNRARIVEYARQHDVTPRAMEFLEQLPDQQYRNMTELFRALPAKSQRRPRPAEQQQVRQQAAEQRGEAEQPAVTPQGGDEEPRAEAAEPAEERAAMPAQWQAAFDLGSRQLCRAALQWQQLWLDGLNRSLQVYGQFWSAWMRR